MSVPTDDLYGEAMKLSPVDREDLAIRLLGSIEQGEVDLHADWDAEIARRVEELRSGRVEAIPAEAVFREMRERRGG